MLDLWLATCAELPAGEPGDVELTGALAAQGLEARYAVWDDPAVDWGAARAVLLRSTWDYHLHLDRFLAWVERLVGATRLLNPPELVRWNARKTYLRDLAEAGVPVVPTTWLPAGPAPDLLALAASRGWREVVVKPEVGANARGALRAGAGGAPFGEAQAHLEALLADGGALVQPYLPAVEHPGERCVVLFDGQPSHALRKPPVLVSGANAPVAVIEAAPDELAVARVALAALSVRPLYARVDLLRDLAGRPCVTELELVEPALYLVQVPGAAERFADAIVRAI